MLQHAIFAPSAAVRRFSCFGSHLMEEGLPDVSSEYASQGTAEHFLCSEAIGGQRDARYLGKKIIVGTHTESGFTGAIWAPSETEEISVDTGCFEVTASFIVDRDMEDRTDPYINSVRASHNPMKDVLLVEHRLPLAGITGEDAEGTPDAIVLKGEEQRIVIHDRKFPYGDDVRAEGNLQMIMYALAVLDWLAGSREPIAKRVRGTGIDLTENGVELVIHQSLGDDSVSDQHTYTVVELEEWREKIRGWKVQCDDVELAVSIDGEDIDQYLTPSAAACKYCRAAGVCSKLDSSVREAVTVAGPVETESDANTAASRLVNLEQLSAAKSFSKLARIWADAVDAQAYRSALAGNKIDGWKLVDGRGGPRKWRDIEEAEKLMLKFKLKHEQMYDRKVISPTSAEKLLGPKGEAASARRWTQCQDIITRKPGAPTLVPDIDKRSEINSDDEFEDLDILDDEFEDLDIIDDGSDLG